MANRFDDLWDSAADDGASSLTGVVLTRADGGADMEGLLDAWYRERADRIECSLVLDKALQLINGFLADDKVSPRLRRQATRLIRTVEDVRRDDQDLCEP